MDKRNKIETIGYILKEEKIATLKQNIIPNTFVIEALEPFPGYHGKDLPQEASVPEFIYFVTKKKYSTEQIARSTKSIIKTLETEIDIARADVTLFNIVYPCIRVRDIKDFAKISELQACLKSEGFEFAKTRLVEGTSMVNIQKHFYLEETEEGIYKDLEEENTMYFEIPIFINWEQFRSITMKIKHSLEGSNFDVAQGLFYRRLGVIDVIRVYDKEPSIDKLKEIRDKYLNEIKKLLLDRFA